MPNAEKEYKTAIATNPKIGESHNNLAVVYMLTDRLSEAEAEMRQAEKVGYPVHPQFKQDPKAAQEKARKAAK